MDPDRLDELERRVAALEAEMEAWRLRARQMIERKYGARPAGRSPERARSVTRSSWQAVVDAVTGEGAIGRIGIGLLLLGIVYAVQYGIDRGWITELVQVVAAGIAGLVLLGLGHVLRPKRPILSRLLTGGGFGALYVAVYAAQAVYGLVPFWPAIAAASVVTAACFMVGTSRDDAAMAVVAVLGGLATPFILRSAESDLPAAVAYVAVVLCAAALLYWRHGWRTLVGWSAVGALPVTILLLVLLHEPDPIPTGWRWAAQAVLLVDVAVLTGIPWLRATRSGPRPAPDPPDWMAPVLPPLVVPVVSALTLLAAWGMERAVWEPAGWIWALAGLALGVGLAGAYRVLAGAGRRLEAAAALVAASWVAAFAFVDLFDGETLAVAGWSLVLAAVMIAGERRRIAGARVAVLGLAVILVFWMPDRLGDAVQGHTPFLSWEALGDVLALGFMAVATREIAHQRFRVFVGLVLWVMVLALAGREFSTPGAVTAAWSIFAVVLLAAGRFGRVYRLIGMLTVVLVVAKLLLFDLSRMNELARVGLFAGFGAVLLVVSYFFPSLWRGGEEPSADADQAARPDR